ncbi:hypothetical protein [Streptomyces sp. D54]|uniref:hypothetical protein n=1 Tax=Streptomyces sp. D54 TaxID=1290289 RepID=UPI003CF55F45
MADLLERTAGCFAGALDRAAGEVVEHDELVLEGAVTGIWILSEWWRTVVAKRSQAYAVASPRSMITD